MKSITLTWLAHGQWVPPDRAAQGALLKEALASAQSDFVLADLRQTEMDTDGLFKVEADIDLTSANENLTLDRIADWIMRRIDQTKAAGSGLRLVILRERE